MNFRSFFDSTAHGSLCVGESKQHRFWVCRHIGFLKRPLSATVENGIVTRARSQCSLSGSFSSGLVSHADFVLHILIVPSCKLALWEKSILVIALNRPSIVASFCFDILSLCNSKQWCRACFVHVQQIEQQLGVRKVLVGPS